MIRKKQAPIIELVSFKLCPFVQRSVITLNHKKIPYNITYIDLADKPSWFLKISPMGKVPVLEVDKEVIFESAVINEYLDEITPPQLLSKIPLVKAKSRAWIEFGSHCIMNQYKLSSVRGEADYEEAKTSMTDNLAHLNDTLSGTPFFSGETLSLVDFAFAPLWTRFEILERKFELDLLQPFPKLQAWSNALLALPAVKNSVVPEFEALYLDSIRDKEAYINTFREK